MESIIINQETGLILIDRFTFHPRLTYSEVEFTYPTLRRKVTDYGFMREAYVHLPQLEFLSYQINTRLTFFNLYISGIDFSRVVDPEKAQTWEENRHEMVVWTRHIKSWLYNTYGSPHLVEPPVLLDEKCWLSSDEIAHLDYWIYRYAWGEFGYTFHWETSASVHFHFDKVYRIHDWDGLRDECRYLLQVNHENLVEKKRNYPFIETAINVLSGHYDYLTVRALLPHNLNCLVFDLPKWSTKVIIDVQPDYPDEPYRISRHDSLHKVYSTADNLVASLKVFLETEKL